MKNPIIFLVFIIVSSHVIIAQQDAQYTQYMYNTLVINSAYAGSRGVLSLNGLHRSQWLGIDGSPNTQTLSIHSPVGKRTGLGLSLINDEIGNGTSQETSIDFAVSYTLQLAKDRKISFGVKAGGHLLNIDFSRLAGFTENQGVSSIANVDNKFSPNFGAGVYYHADRIYFGVSVPNFLQTKHFDNSATTSEFLSKERMNWYFISGYVFDINSNFKLKPAFLFKMVSGAPLQTDLSISALMNQRFSLGVAYRWDAAASAFAGFHLNGQFMLGVAYDKETTELGNTSFNDGSFEVFLRYEFKRTTKNVIAPRFF